jgi:serine/threonine protein kinase
MLSGSLPNLTTNVQPSRVVGRYVIYDEIACGGMATVSYGRLLGDVGFSRTVAIKQLHPQFSRNGEFVSMFLNEARLSSRIQHPNVAVPFDVVFLEQSEELFLIMEYIHGDNLSHMIGGARIMKHAIPPTVSASIMSGALHGLHAAHEAVNERGEPLNIVHRDISPDNIMIGVDGVPRVLDFGVAKAASRCQSTTQGRMKGKLSYMAPEQMGSGEIDRRVDIFTAGIVLWESLTLQRLFKGEDVPNAISKIINAPISRPSAINPAVPLALDRVVMKALDRDVNRRFHTAHEFAAAIEEATRVATPRQVGEWIKKLCDKNLSKRSLRVSQIEISSLDTVSSNDPQQALRFKQGTTPPPLIGENPGKGTSGSSAGQIAKPSDPIHESTISRGELLPQSLNERPTWAWMRITTWPFIAGASFLAILAVVGTVLLSHQTGVNAAGEARSERPVPTSFHTHAGPVHETPPQLNPASPSSSAPTEPRATVPALALPEPAVFIPANDTSATTEPVRRTGSPPHHATPKLQTVKLSKTNKQTGKKNCNPPFNIDSQGIRRVKPECL